MAALGVTGGAIWVTPETTIGCSVIPTGKAFPLFITKACWHGGATLPGTAVLMVVGTGTVGWGKTPEEDEEGGAEKG